MLYDCISLLVSPSMSMLNVLISSFRQGGKTYINVPNPRYLGPAVSLGAIHVASIQDIVTEIFAFKGNKLSDVANNKENKASEYLTYATPSSKKRYEHVIFANYIY